MKPHGQSIVGAAVLGPEGSKVSEGGAMTPPKKAKATQSPEVITPSGGPLVFISHDARDADLAEAFGKLLKSVSAGMIKTFRSSDKKGTDGIDFGDEWYKRLMGMLQATSDVVCLFTERSVDRPWILFEAGVAKGKLSTPVIGVALGIPLNRIGTGPFYQFQNMDDSEADLTKLVHQLARRIPGLELDADVVEVQVAAFKAAEADLLKKINSPSGKKGGEGAVEENSVAKLVEEMKALPTRVAERLAEADSPLAHRRRARRLHPMLLDELVSVVGETGDPIGILVAASMFREDAPWLYEISIEAYRALKSGDAARIEIETARLQHFMEFAMRSGAMMEWGFSGKEEYMVCREFMGMLLHTMGSARDRVQARTQRKTARNQAAQS